MVGDKKNHNILVRIAGFRANIENRDLWSRSAVHFINSYGFTWRTKYVLRGQNLSCDQ